MNIILTLISSHLLSVIESALISDEPQIVATIEKELELLIMKLESFIKTKSPSASAIVTPILNSVNTVSDVAIEAAGNAALAQQ
jgi:hypothetical protein